MKLLIDIGNTRIKWAIFQNEQLSDIQSFAHTDKNFTEQLGKHWQDMPTPEEFLVANVAGSSIGKELSKWSQAKWQLDPLFLKTKKTAGAVTNGYDKPDQLGVDRWLAMIGAYQLLKQGDATPSSLRGGRKADAAISQTSHEFATEVGRQRTSGADANPQHFMSAPLKGSRPTSFDNHHGTPNLLCIIDCGSAITVDFVDTNGQHLGGLITPGWQKLLNSLNACDALDVGASSPSLRGGHKADAAISQTSHELATEVGWQRASGANVNPQHLLSAPLKGSRPTSKDFPPPYAREGQGGGINTLDAITRGCTQQIASFLNSCLTPNVAHIYITGGDAERFLPFLPNSVIHQPDLIFRGMLSL